MKNTFQKPVLIFDFDGTIADTLALLISIANSLAEEFHFRKIDKNDIGLLKNKSAIDIVRYLKIPVSKIPVIAYQVRHQMRRHIMEAPVAEGLKDVLSKMRLRDSRMGILTSNSRENVLAFLHHNKIEHFDFYKTSIGIWDKKTRIKQLIKEQKLNPENMVYIADEIRDIEAARSVGIKIASVAWGYNHRDALALHNPDYLFSRPEELLTLLEK